MAALITLLIGAILIGVALHTYLRYPPEEYALSAPQPKGDPDPVEYIEVADITDFLRLGDNDIVDDQLADLQGGDDPDEASLASDADADITPSSPDANQQVSTTVTNTQSTAQANNDKPRTSREEPNVSDAERRRQAETDEARRRQRAEEKQRADSQRKVGKDMNRFKGENKAGNGQSHTDNPGGGRKGDKNGTLNGTALRGRTLIAAATPDRKAPWGTVKVRIIVRPDGTVRNAVKAGGSISDNAIIASCVAASKRLRYNKVADSEGDQSGIITWYYE